jgi:hypothetical protein
MLSGSYANILKIEPLDESVAMKVSQLSSLTLKPYAQKLIENRE